MFLKRYINNLTFCTSQYYRKKVLASMAEVMQNLKQYD